MQNVSNLNDLNTIINNNDCVAVYFSSTTCSVCNVLKNKMEFMFSKNFPLFKTTEITIKQNTLYIAACHNVFTAPTLLIFFRQKEFLRKVNNWSVTELIESIKRPYNILTK